MEFAKTKTEMSNVFYRTMQRMLPMALNVPLAIEAAMWLMVLHSLDHWLEHCYLQPAKNKDQELKPEQLVDFS